MRSSHLILNINVNAYILIMDERKTKVYNFRLQRRIIEELLETVPFLLDSVFFKRFKKAAKLVNCLRARIDTLDAAICTWDCIQTWRLVLYNVFIHRDIDYYFPEVFPSSKG